MLAIAAGAWEKGNRDATALLAAASLAMVVHAVLQLQKTRLFVYHPASRTLRRVERTWRGRREDEASTQKIRVLLDSRLVLSRYLGKGGGEKRLVHQDVGFMRGTGERWLLARDFMHPNGEICAERVAEDLGCELLRAERQVW